VNHWTAQRWAAVAGILFAIVFVIANVIAGEPAGYNAGGAEISAFLADKHVELTIQSILSSFEIVLWLWFLSIFAGTFREAGQAWLATIVYGAGVMTLAIGAVGDALLIAVLRLFPILDQGAVQAIYGVCFFLYLKSFWALVAVAVASALATLRSRVLPAWYAYASLAGAVVFLLGGLAVRMSGFFSPIGAMPLIASLVFALWVLISSVLLVLRLSVGTEARPAVSPATA
jgi:hypothetical protein